MLITHLEAILGGAMRILERMLQTKPEQHSEMIKDRTARRGKEGVCFRV